MPVANRVGDENDGWRVAMVTFSFERGTGFLNELLSAQRELHELVAVAKKVTRRGALAWDDAEIRREVAWLRAEAGEIEGGRPAVAGGSEALLAATNQSREARRAP